MAFMRFQWVLGREVVNHPKFQEKSARPGLQVLGFSSGLGPRVGPYSFFWAFGIPYSFFFFLFFFFGGGGGGEGGVGFPYSFLFVWGLGFPYNQPLETTKGALFHS